MTESTQPTYQQNPYAEQFPPQAQASPTIVINNSASAVATANGFAGPQKSTQTAYLLWFFLGAVGAHKFYLGKTGMGVLYIFTAGLFLVGIIYDLFTLGRQVRQYNAGIR